MCERHRSPRSVSGAEGGGTYDGVLYAEAFRWWSLTIMRRAEVHPDWTEEHGRVIAAFALRIPVEHIAIIDQVLDGYEDDGVEHAPAVAFEAGESPPDAALIVEQVVTPASIARALYGPDAGRAMRDEVARLHREGLQIVRSVMPREKDPLTQPSDFADDSGKVATVGW